MDNAARERGGGESGGAVEEGRGETGERGCDAEGGGRDAENGEEQASEDRSDGANQNENGAGGAKAHDTCAHEGNSFQDCKDDTGEIRTGRSSF